MSATITNPVEQMGSAGGPSAEPSAKPSATGRDDKGRFTAGNAGGPGNPYAREVARLRRRLLAKVTDEEMDAIADKLIAQAKDGDVTSVKLLFSYTMGKPAAATDPDQLDAAEWQHWRQTAGMMYELPRMIARMMPGAVLHMVREGRPLASDALCKKMAHALAHPETVMPEVPELVMEEEDDAPAPPTKEAPHSAAGEKSERDGAAPSPEPTRRAPVPRNPAASKTRLRAWGIAGERFGLPPSTDGGSGRKKDRNKRKPPSAKGGTGSLNACANGSPSRNGSPASGAA